VERSARRGTSRLALASSSLVTSHSHMAKPGARRVLLAGVEGKTASRWTGRVATYEDFATPLQVCSASPKNALRVRLPANFAPRHAQRPVPEPRLFSPKVSVRISGGDANVHYDVSGGGPGLVLVHGTATTREQWLPLTEAVRNRFTVVAPNYSGSGLTTDHGGPLTPADLAAEVLAAADHAGLDRFHLVGHSLGSAVATHLAGTHPSRVRSLFLHAGWVKTDVKMDAEFRYWLDLLEHGTEAFARMLPLMAFGPNYWASATVEANETWSPSSPGGSRRGRTGRTRSIAPWSSPACWARSPPRRSSSAARTTG
jgi:pimeloyl-ACP methyl ester carboxylesterase